MPNKKKKETTHEYIKPRALEKTIYVTPTDIKNWIYCPIIVYLHRVLKIKPKTETTQTKGKEIHKQEITKILRRKGIQPHEKTIYILKQPEVELTAPPHHLKGKIDLIAMNQHGEIFPIEIKHTTQKGNKPWLDHKYQLAAEALLIEHNYKKPVTKAYIYYTKTQKTTKIRITQHLKTHTKTIIKKIIQTIQTEKPPKPTKQKTKCTGGCGYKEICNYTNTNK